MANDFIDLTENSVSYGRSSAALLALHRILSNSRRTGVKSVAKTLYSKNDEISNILI